MKNTSDSNITQNIPNYKRIFEDILRQNYPEKINECSEILSKKQLTIIDVLTLNKKIFGTKTINKSQRLRSYDTKTIHYILEYQIKNKLNNTQLALHFKLSRNTVAKWKKNSKEIKIN